MNNLAPHLNATMQRLTKSKTFTFRPEIAQSPTDQELDLIKQYGQKLDNKCLDCSKALYYFNQCDACYSKMISGSKLD